MSARRYEPLSREEREQIRRADGTTARRLLIELEVAEAEERAAIGRVKNAKAERDAAEERAARAEALLRAWGIPVEPAPDLMAALKASLADDAARGGG